MTGRLDEIEQMLFNDLVDHCILPFPNERTYADGMAAAIHHLTGEPVEQIRQAAVAAAKAQDAKER